jgi:hypothetical protein
MNETAQIISVIAGIFFIVALVMIIAELSAIKKSQIKTINVLIKILEQSGGKLSKEDYKKLNS